MPALLAPQSLNAGESPLAVPQDLPRAVLFAGPAARHADARNAFHAVPVVEVLLARAAQLARLHAHAANAAQVEALRAVLEIVAHPSTALEIHLPKPVQPY